jgi:hypothetical protein
MLSSNLLFGAVQKVHINVPLIDLSGFVSIALQNCENLLKDVARNRRFAEGSS